MPSSACRNTYPPVSHRTLTANIRNRAANVVLLLAALATCLVAIELASRILIPISPGTRFLDAAGAPVEIHDGRGGLRAKIRFRQVTADYDVWTSISPEGFRGPQPEGNINTIFVGDSFTFGQGLTDEQTIPSLACSNVRLACANLGLPGTGTKLQIDRLEQFLANEDWHPQHVDLLLFAYAGGLASGNDFADTVQEAALPSSTGKVAPPQAASFWERFLGWRSWVLANSNLVRIVYQGFGPRIRSLLSASSAPDIGAGIAAVGVQLARLNALSRSQGFTYTVYVLHPVQDLLRGSYNGTLAAVQEAAGGARIVDTALTLLDNPSQYYFPYDGHLNALGAARVAALIASDATGH